MEAERPAITVAADGSSGYNGGGFRRKGTAMDQALGRRVEEMVREAWGGRDPLLSVECRLRPDGKIELRVVSTAFEALDSLEREALLWEVLRPLPSADAVRMTYSLLLTPAEARRYFAGPGPDDVPAVGTDTTDGSA